MIKTTKNLPHFKSDKRSKAKMDIVRTELFEVYFPEKVSKSDQKLLKDFIVSVVPGQMIFNLNVVKNKMTPLLELLKLTKLKKSDLIVKMHDKSGKVHTIITYKKCKFNVDVNAVLNLSYDHSQIDPPKAYVNFNYEKLIMSMTDNKGKTVKERIVY